MRFYLGMHSNRVIVSVPILNLFFVGTPLTSSPHRKILSRVKGSRNQPAMRSLDPFPW